MAFAKTKDTESLFLNEVEKCFQFLEREYGFSHRNVSKIGHAITVKYKSHLTFVNISYGPPGYEPELSFGRIGIDDSHGGYSFSQGDLVLLEDCKNWKWSSNDPNLMTGMISEFARLLRYCGSGCLRGDNATYDEMKARRDAAVEAYKKEENIKKIRKEAELAWHKADYHEVAILYNRILGDLTDLENKRLSYCKKRVFRS